MSRTSNQNQKMLQPTRDLIFGEKFEEKKKSGIIIPDGMGEEEMPVKLRITAIGPEVGLNEVFSIGQIVLFKKFGLAEVPKHKGLFYGLEDDVLAILSTDPDEV